MKKFAIAQFNNFDAELALTISEAESEYDAVVDVLTKNYNEPENKEQFMKDYPDMKSIMDNHNIDEFYITVKEII